MKTNRLYILKAEYVGGVSLQILYSDGVSKTVDFHPFLASHPHPQYNKYNKPENFKKFKIEYGNVVWGKNWDLVFPIETLYSGNIS